MHFAGILSLSVDDRSSKATRIGVSGFVDLIYLRFWMSRGKMWPTIAIGKDIRYVPCKLKIEIQPDSKSSRTLKRDSLSNPKLINTIT